MPSPSLFCMNLTAYLCFIGGVEYRKALAEGEMDVAYGRLMVLGAAGVGKTSFKRSLMKEPWDPLVNSTIISDVHSL